jgi:superfamily II DNA or RNA helicase
LIQYAGIIHREHIGKKEVAIYDYLDSSLGLTMSMFKKRLKGYIKMPYHIEADTLSSPSVRKVDVFN